MKAILTRLALASAMLVAALGVWAQEPIAASIEFSTGDDIVIIRGGRRLPFKDPIGLELLEGDQVQTGKGVFVEMRLGLGGAVLKLAENTTFVLERLDDGQTSIQLVYGRIRAKVARLAGTDTFSVRSAQAIAGVRGTDFGLDVMASRSSSSGSPSVGTMTRAYCFEGAVEVIAFIRSGAIAAEALEAIPRTYMIEAGEMVRIESDVGKAEASKGSVDEAIRAFWTTNDYVLEASSSLVAPFTTAAGGKPSAAESAAEDKAIFERGYASGYETARAEFGIAPGRGTDSVPEGFVSQEEVDAIRKTANLRLGGIIAAGLMGVGASAAAIQGFVMIGAGDTAGGITVLGAGAIVGAGAIPFLLLSLFARP